MSRGLVLSIQRKEKIMSKRPAPILFIALLISLTGLGIIIGQETTALFEQPVVITSAGQSADVQIAAVLAKRAGLNYELIKLATAKDLENAKTLAIVLGASLKGLGAAGLDMEKERARVAGLVAEAQKKNIPILCLHLGGQDRRGQQTDDLIREILPFAKMAIVVKSGNHDGIFTKICQPKNIPLVEVEKTADTVTVLQKVFK
jgi:hypothetical protein